MKKFSIIFLFALAVLTAGCAKDIETGNKPLEQTPSWIYDESLPVPIQFGASGMDIKTKSSFNSLADMSGEKLGIVAVDIQEEWADDGGVKNSDVFCLDDEIVTCEYNEAKNRHMIEFAEPRYYPYMSQHNFSFFTYYRGQNPNALVYKSESVNLPLTGIYWGCQDIVWSRADADTLFVKKSATSGEYVPALRGEDATGYYNGYNASYVRYIAKNNVDQERGIDHTYNTNLPTLTFEHVTTNIRFVAVLDPTIATDFDMIPTITQVRLSGDEVYAGADLTIVHKNAQKAGTIDVTGYNKGVLALHNGDGNTTLNIVPDTDGEALLDGFFIQPISEDSPLNLEVDLSFANGYKTTVKAEIKKHIKYEAGFFYTYEVKLYRAVGIEIAVSELIEWKNGFEADKSDDILGTDDTPNTLS